MSASALDGTAPAPASAKVAGGWILAAAAVVAAFLLFSLLAEAFAPAPAGPTGSSFATTPGGAAAWAELLAREGHPVIQLRRPLDSAPLPPEATLVVLAAPSLSSAAGANLDRFVEAGGRLVVGGGDTSAVLPALLRRPPAFTSPGSTFAHPVGGAPETAGVGTVETARGGAFASGPGQVVLAGRAGALMLALRRGQGRLDLLADASPLENGLLATADNAQLALNLAGPAHTPVIFAEALHGYGEATGLAAIPARWWVAFGGLLLAGAAWVLGRGRRLGPAEVPAPEPAPPRSAYVDALATAVIRAGRKGKP